MTGRMGEDRQVRRVLESFSLFDGGRYRTNLARQWLYHPESIQPAELFDELEGLDDLALLLGPAAAVRVFGPSEIWRERLLVMRETTAALPRPLEGGRMSAACGDALVKRLRFVVERLAEAERVLDEAGYRLNPATWRMERTRAASRPYTWRRKLVVRIAEALTQMSIADISVDQELREQVAEELYWLLPSDETDPSRHGPIDNDLRNEQKKRK